MPLPPPPAKPEWKDVTSYSYMPGQRRGEARADAWEVAHKGLRISIHGWIHEKDVWFVSCPQLGLDRVRLQADIADAESAKLEALQVARRSLEDKLDAMKELASLLSGNFSSVEEDPPEG